jgi:hypothetical protein
MSNKEEQLQSLTEIKNLIESSSRFTALNGLAGISAGIIAIFGCLYAAFSLDFPLYTQAKTIMHWTDTANEKITLKFLITTALAVFVLAFAAFMFFINRKAKSNNVKLFNHTGRKFILNHCIFLLAGGLFALVLVYYNIFFLVVPALLIFYGLGLINISKFSFNSIRNLGLIEIALGFILCFMPVYALLFFFVGFGVLHIIYGLVFHFNYDRVSE